ncbi:MAG: hypothetical protein E7160_02905 [Firmicutes bacterium]|nr:hypothetical protein [Bacillota bacterium]
MEKDNKGISNNKVIVVVLILTVVIVIGLVVGLCSFKNKQNKKVKIQTDTEVLSVVYSKEVNGLNMKEYIPLKDEVGKKLSNKAHYFDFNVKSEMNNDVSIKYELVLRKDENCNLDDSQIKVYLEKENEGTYVKMFDPKLYKGLKKTSSIGSHKNDMILYSDKIVDNINDKYRLRVWLDEKASVKTAIQCSLSVSIYAKIEK